VSSADVLVVGAGPVGLTAALALVRRGLRVDLVERREGLGSASLAATFHPPTLQILADLAVDLSGQGLKASTVGYRADDGGSQVRFDLAELADETAYPYRRHVPQLTVCQLMLSALRHSPRCRIRFGCSASEAMLANYPWVFAADGADSGLRTAAGVGFPGDEYAGTVVRLLCDPAGFDGWDAVSYVFSQDISVSVLRMIDHVRVIVRAEEGVVDPQSAAQEVAARVTGVTPVVRSWSQYRSQRRVIEDNLRDNVIFVGDSAHVTTTRGGMNMNAGIHDAAVLATVLARDPGGLAAAARDRLAIAREKLLPRTHDTLDAPAARLVRVRAVHDDPPARAEFLRRTAMLDMVSWP